MYGSLNSKHSERKEIILVRIQRDIAIKKVNTFLEYEQKYHYINLEKVNKFTAKQKIEFINDYGKYLSENDLSSLIFRETNSSPLPYFDLLKSLHLELLDNQGINIK